VLVRNNTKFVHALLLTFTPTICVCQISCLLCSNELSHAVEQVDVSNVAQKMHRKAARFAYICWRDRGDICKGSYWFALLTKIFLE